MTKDWKLLAPSTNLHFQKSSPSQGMAIRSLLSHGGYPIDLRISIYFYIWFYMFFQGHGDFSMVLHIFWCFPWGLTPPWPYEMGAFWPTRVPLTLYFWPCGQTLTVMSWLINKLINQLIDWLVNELQYYIIMISSNRNLLFDLLSNY